MKLGGLFESVHERYWKMQHLPPPPPHLPPLLRIQRDSAFGCLNPIVHDFHGIFTGSLVFKAHSGYKELAVRSLLFLNVVGILCFRMTPFSGYFTSVPDNMSISDRMRTVKIVRVYTDTVRSYAAYGLAPLKIMLLILASGANKRWA